MKPNRIQTRIKALAVLAVTFCTACGNTGCNNPKPGRPQSNDIAAITSFHYNECNTTVANGNESYDVKLMPDGKVIAIFDNGNPLWGKVEVDKSVLDSLQQIVYKHKMHKYKKEYRPKFDVCDGTMWSMGIRFADNTSVNSSGDNAWPKNSGEAFKAVTELLMPYRIHMWEGTYAQKPEDFPEYEYGEDDIELTEMLEAAPFFFTVENIEADSTCTVTVTAKNNFTLQCKGKIDKYDSLHVFLTDVIKGHLPKGKPTDLDEPLFSIHPILFMECDDPAMLGLEDETHFVKIKK